MSKFDFTIKDFKQWAARQAGFLFQPAPGWVKTTYDQGDQVNYGNKSYVSLVDMNIDVPSAGVVADPATWAELEAYDKKLELWKQPIAYSKGDRVIALDANTYKFFLYESLVNDNYDDPSTTKTIEKTQLSEADLSSVILDSEIQEAMTEAKFKFNERLFSDNAEKMTAFALLTAFFLVYDRQMAASGTGSTYSGLPASKRIGEMSISYMADPALAKGSQSYAFFARNQYGLKYYNLVQTRLKAATIFGGRTSDI